MKTKRTWVLIADEVPKHLTKLPVHKLRDAILDLEISGLPVSRRSATVSTGTDGTRVRCAPAYACQKPSQVPGPFDCDP